MNCQHLKKWDSVVVSIPCIGPDMTATHRVEEIKKRSIKLTDERWYDIKTGTALTGEEGYERNQIVR